MKRAVNVVLPSVGTMAVMNYADEHKDEYFDHTHFQDINGFSTLVVSEDAPAPWLVECMDENGWHDLPNGWQRTGEHLSGWTCRKKKESGGYRYIFITD